LQIVCSTLWERARRTNTGFFQITNADYDALGGPAGQVEEHLDRVLLARARNNSMSLQRAFREGDRWRSVLMRLVRTQADGSVTTDIVKQCDLVQDCVSQKCEMDPTLTLAHLAHDDVRILREVYVIDRQTRQNTLCYSLGHDTLGLVLRRWKLIQVAGESRGVKFRWRLRALGVGIVCAGGLLFILTKSSSFGLRAVGWQLGPIMVAYGLGFLLLSFRKTEANPIPPRYVAKIFEVIWSIYLSPKHARELLSKPELRRTFEVYPKLRWMLIERAMEEDLGFLNRLRSLAYKLSK
jgi:hypothetical protein